MDQEALVLQRPEIALSPRLLQSPALQMAAPQMAALQTAAPQMVAPQMKAPLLLPPQLALAPAPLLSLVR